MTKTIITVSRQFASGGKTIARELATRLGYDYYDKEIIESVAEKTGFSKQFIAEKSERSPGRTIFSYGFDTGSFMPGVMYGMSANDYIWTEQSKIIKGIADSGKPCVIVGRSADYILKDYDNALHAFICADIEFRKRRVVEEYGETDVKPEKRILDKDKRRALNHKFFTDLEWGYAPNYDICLNSGVLGIDRCVDILIDLVK